MPFRRLQLPASIPGAVWLAPMPGRTEGWTAFVAEAERRGITRILCLNPLHEVASGSPDYHRAVTGGQLPWTFTSLPMRNFGLGDEDQFRAAIDDVAKGLAAGDSVLIHCSAGLGRTGTAAACLLKRLGLSAEDAAAQVQAAGSNPQSAVQSGLIDRF